MSSQSKFLLLSAGLLFLIVIIIFPFLMFWLLDVPVTWWVGLVSREIILPLGIDNLPRYLHLPIAFLILSSPFLTGLILIVLWQIVPDQPRGTDKFLSQITKITEAKHQFQNSILLLDDLKSELEQKASQHEKLSALVNQLDRTSKDTAEDLRAKLDSIAYVNRYKEMIKLFVSFILGLSASLIATAIWESIK